MNRKRPAYSAMHEGHAPIEEFLDGLETEALQHRAVQHPYLAAMAAGRVDDLGRALVDFATQYHAYCSQFQRYLTLAIGRLTTPAHRTALLHNLREETGVLDPEKRAALEAAGVECAWVDGIPHPDLFVRFCRSLDAAVGSSVGSPETKVVRWRESLCDMLTTANDAEAVGALGFGTENIVCHIYPYFISAIKMYGRISRRDAIFFELHCLADDDHARTLRRIAGDLAVTEDGRWDLRRGMHKALFLRAAFWDWLYDRTRRGRTV